LTFDPIEFDRVLTIRDVAQVGIDHCGDPSVITFITNLTDVSRRQAEYSKYRSARPEVAAASARLNAIIEGLGRRYRSRDEPSAVYCRQKFENVINGTHMMLDALGKQ
jgi:hypothetical protein